MHLYQYNLHNIAHMESFQDLFSVIYNMLCFKKSHVNEALNIIT